MEQRDNRKLRILIIAMPDSIHTVRWLSMLEQEGWEIHLFPSIDHGIMHPDLKCGCVHHSAYERLSLLAGKFGVGQEIKLVLDVLARACKHLVKKICPDYRAKLLKKVIERIRPDIIHSLEIQHAGYLTHETKKIMMGKFPPWIVTNWGSDIYLFGRLSAHEQRIRDVMSSCDYYSCECHRDVRLAHDFGFHGRVLPVFPNTGGFDMEAVSRLRRPGPTSERRVIMLKGYQHWAGRALVGLRALERCADALKGYEIIIYSAFPDVEIAAELFGKTTGVPVRIVPMGTAHEEILRLHGKARVSIGLSISDAISTSFLEALVMGAFPIQSRTSCADEWAEDGKGTILVPPDDSEIVEKAIRRALSDNELVNRAAEHNYAVAKERLDRSSVKPKAVAIYTTIAGERRLV